MFESVVHNLIQQMVFNQQAFGVWVPLTFGLSIGLAYAIISGLRRRK